MTPVHNADIARIFEESAGVAMHCFTGSKAHNIAVRRLAQTKGLKINEYGVFRSSLTDLRRIIGRGHSGEMRPASPRRAARPRRRVGA